MFSEFFTRMLKRPKMQSFVKILKIGTHTYGYPKPEISKNIFLIKKLEFLRIVMDTHTFGP